MNNIYGYGLPVAASTYASKIDFGIWLIHAAMITIFVLWSIFFAYLLIKYRRRPGVPARREEHSGELASLMPDIVVMLFEIGLIVFYAIPVWGKIKMTLPPARDSVLVNVEAEQFAWNVHYPGPDGKFGATKESLIRFSNPIGLDSSDPAAADDVVVANELHLPVGKPALIHLTSLDVIHDFFVPAFRIKQDIVPGMDIPIWITPTRVGHYELACAQLCGFGHSLMRGDVYVQSQADYDAWLKSRAAAKPKTAPATEGF
ncbi:MAG: hypothetical protein KGM24_11795 [Elusimicrobia bacterium]|nr:hypothetical protein [Elusimicrobiota bacterium]